MPELVFLRRGEEVLRFALEKARTVLGRGEKCDVVIPDAEVSRSHAALLLEGQSVVLEDLSGKGTRVSGVPISHSVLSDGADISLGQWRAVFRQRNQTEPEAAATDLGGTDTDVLTQEASASAGPPVQVRVRHGGNESVHKFSGTSFLVGTDPTNDLVLEDRFISGKHVKLARKGMILQIADQGSTNGTFLGNLRIHEAEAPIPAVVRLGETELVVEPSAGAKKDSSYCGIIGTDGSVKQLIELIDRVAPSSATVAIFGESGTGKELVAQAVHSRSNRADRPFIPVNCAAISKELIESELFGHEKGAFTGAAITRKGAFEEADGGTIFLDEVGELPLDLQAKLLRALESGEIKRVGASRPMHVDVRVVAATNKDLQGAIRDGEFREDLYYRLCVIPLHLSPLKNRKGDLLTLAEHFMKTFSPRGQTISLTPAAIERLKFHHWPGNIRELRNVIHRALLLRRGPMIDASDLSFGEEVNPDVGIAVPELPPGITLEQMLDKLERQIVEAALRRYNNNRERVAKELGIARSTLFKRLKEWGLTRQDETE
jgi:two-component system, NtrC family, response regulator HydG